MATPFQAFRKHQKAFMATAAVLCMVIFVFASALDGSGSRAPDGGRALSAKVASWKGGSLNEGELGRSVVERRILNDFLRRLYFEGMRLVGEPQTPNVPNFVFDPQESPQTVERLVIDTEIMANLAQQAGITVDDSVINHYITEFGLRRVPTDQVRAILANVGRGDIRANEAMVFSQLRKLLMAHYYRSSTGDASFVVLPEQRWSDWRKVNERISLVAAVLPTADFVEAAGEPTDAQVRALYEQYKEQEPNRLVAIEGRLLDSPEPGFAQPRRVKLRYLSGNLDSWTERYRDQVTDAEIADYYERNKRSEFVKSSLPGTSPPMSFEEFESGVRGADEPATGE
ncbi:MAG: hypothetical protein KDB00_02845, partial [Planctomycetales bacterium]|nr:hypothetical protein [Planctomycetales bacterium]